MIKKLFGTDGIRGTSNQGVMTADISLKLGAAIGTVFNRRHKKNLVVIGKDTRLSGYLLEPAITSGFISVGTDVLLVGPMPTPAISMLIKSLRADMGIMISASHNPYHDNGIKVFDANGIKLEKSLETEIEKIIAEYPNNIEFASPDQLGRAKRLDDAPGRYIEFAKSTFPKTQTLKNLKIVIDSANGAAYHVAEKIFWELGAEIISIENKPDGFNINKNCGSTHPENLQKIVVEHKADLGIALDGDADRLILVDNEGQLINGDKIIAVIALHFQKLNKLKDNIVVTTHMSNISLEAFLKQHNIILHRADVGDKFVYREIIKNNLSLGGEQSGHIIIPEFCSTGDGIIAALQVLASFIASDKNTLSEFFDIYTDTPQILYNIPIKSTTSLESPSVNEAIKKVKSKLGALGRVLIRKSGTEPLIRVMIEHPDIATINQSLESIKTEILKCH
ncbi:MAG: phosphoglucosamine mutase [Rickettsiales bacterium]|nr:phosphoglucosamine mutase [Rickettsiales bacterium]